MSALDRLPLLVRRQLRDPAHLHAARFGPLASFAGGGDNSIIRANRERRSCPQVLDGLVRQDHDAVTSASLSLRPPLLIFLWLTSVKPDKAPSTHRLTVFQALDRSPPGIGRR